MLQVMHNWRIMRISLENFDFIRQCGEELYKSFQSVKCPYFKESVHFTAEGLAHLKYKYRDRDRQDEDQYMRFKLLHLAPLVLKLSRTVQGMVVRKGFERCRRNGKTLLIPAGIIYYEFIAILDHVRVRVIVKQINEGQLQFWSIIPYWSGKAVEKVIHFGNPEVD